MPEKSKKTVMIIAGEVSGDIHGAHLAREMKTCDPRLQIIGLGGDRMRDAGVEMIFTSGEIAVVGVTEVIFKLGGILKAMGRVRRALRERRPDLLILIDFPDFNLMLAAYAKKIGIRVMYYISPQVWAWRSGRIAKIKKNVEKMVVIFPFEEDLYRRHQVEVSFVGHPLLDEVKTRFSREEARAHFHLRAGVPTIALMPGSRRQEVARHLPVMLEAGERINKQLGQVQYLLPLAATIPEELISTQLRRSPLPVKLVKQDIYEAITAVDLAIVASGTATLEVALLGRPLIVIYRVSWLSYLIGRLFIKVRHIGLVNIIAGRTLMPELIQRRANPEEIAVQALGILADGERRAEMSRELARLKDSLGRPGAARRAAGIACDMIGGGD